MINFLEFNIIKIESFLLYKHIIFLEKILKMKIYHYNRYFKYKYLKREIRLLNTIRLYINL